MRFGWVALLLSGVIGAGAAGGATWLVRHNHAQSGNLHDVVHKQFELSAAEKARLEAAEQRYNSRRAVIEGDIRGANSRLAAAIKRDPEMSPEALAASAAVEASAAELQRVTLQHIFEMRTALDPSHRSAYDDVLVKALTRGQ